MATTEVSQSSRPPFWRDIRVLSILGQIVFVVLIALFGYWLYGNGVRGMQRVGMTGNYNFLNQSAGFEIGVTTISYTPADSYWRAFQVGIANTLSVVILGIILATILGIIAGVAQLSSNWLIAKIFQVYIAIFRNTPLLVQLFFWWSAVFLTLPRVQQAIELPGPIFLSNRGVAMIGLERTASFLSWLIILLIGLAAAWGVARYLKQRQDQTGKQSPRFWIGLGIVLVAGLVGALIVGVPFTVSMPERKGFNFTGGFQMSPEYAALLIGLVVYTGAFIAEAVRGGILGIAKGQKEAASALGLSSTQSMRLVVLPQALRIIVPPVTNQYLNLAKNSSLAIAIGFPDMYSVARTISNQTGQAVQMIGLIMLSYLTISLITSLIMNIYNRKVRLVER
jgi:general L-amino acid transport system permease protein